MTTSRHVAVAAPAGGILLGFLDFVWIKYVPFPFGGLGNSLAVWAVAAFVLTYLGRWPLLGSAAGAVVFLVVAVPSYYLAAALIQHDELTNIYSSIALLWMGLGVIAGVVFGGAGAVARTPGQLQAAALALPGSVLFAEAIIHALRIGDPSFGVVEPLSLAAVLVTLGLLITLLVAPTWRKRGLAVLLAVPLTTAGLVLLTAAGIR